MALVRELEEILRGIRDLRHWHVFYSVGFTVRTCRQSEDKQASPREVAGNGKHSTSFIKQMVYSAGFTG